MLKRLAIACAVFVGVCALAAAYPGAVRIVAHGTVSGISTESVELTFGVLEGATDAFDARNAVDGIVDFVAPPPSPAAWGNQAPAPYFRNLSEPRSHLQLLSADMRGIPTDAADEILWTLVIEADGGFLPVVTAWSLTWAVSDAPAEWAELRMSNESDGSTIDMLATTTLPVRLGVTTVYTIRALPAAPPVRAPAVAEAGVGVALEALVYGSADRVVSALLYYARAGEAIETSTAFVAGVGDIWTASIPASHVTMAGVVWRAVTENVATGMHATHSRSEPGYIPVAGSASLTLRPTAGVGPIWNIVAPTVWPDVADIAATLDGPAGGFLAGWVAWRWNAATQRWEAAAPLGDGTPVATDGFAPALPWFVAAIGGTWHTPGTTVDPTRTFSVPLSVGWNLLANPFPFPVAWSDEGVAVRLAGDPLTLSAAISAGILDERLVYLDVESQTYTTRHAGSATPYLMPPGQGWWLYAEVGDATLLISPASAGD
jgi:hypothetical protein